MKKLLTLCVLLLGVNGLASAQSMMACCAKPANATESFAMLASNTDFSGGHDAPLPYLYAGEGQTDKRIKPADGQPGQRL